MLLCHLLAERVQESALESGVGRGHSHLCGVITEVLRGGLIVVAPVTGHFENGLSIYLVNENYFVERKIENIQINGKDVSVANFVEQSEIGMKLDGKGKIVGQIYILRALAPAQPQ